MRFAAQVSIILTLGELSIDDPAVQREIALCEGLRGPAELVRVGSAAKLWSWEGRRGRGGRKSPWLWAGADHESQREVGAKRATRRYLWFVRAGEVDASALERFWAGVDARIEEDPLVRGLGLSLWTGLRRGLGRSSADWATRAGFAPAQDRLGAVAAMVSTPGYSPPPRGWTPEAHGLAIESLFNLLHSARDRMGFHPFWAVREELGYLDPRWRSFPRLRQGEGDDKQRAYLVYHELLDRFGAAILVGQDFPQLRSRDLMEARAGLERGSFVLGPTRDAGVFLLAGNQAIPWSVWGDFDERSGFEALRSRLTRLAGAGRVGVISPLGSGRERWPEDVSAGLRDLSYPVAQQGALERLVALSEPGQVPGARG